MVVVVGAGRGVEAAGGVAGGGAGRAEASQGRIHCGEGVSEAVVECTLCLVVSLCLSLSLSLFREG